MQAGNKATLTKDANLKYDSYGSDRPDKKTTQTLKKGTQVEITKVVDNPKPGQTHVVQINNAGWVEKSAVFVTADAVKGIKANVAAAVGKSAAASAVAKPGAPVSGAQQKIAPAKAPNAQDKKRL